MTCRIKDIRAIPVNIPYRSTPVMTCGEIAASTRTIIVVETTTGDIGYGEASYAFPADIIGKEFAPALIGLDALDHALLRRHCLPRHLDLGTPSLKMRLAVWGGLEIALWDLLAKRSGLPLYRLLGGAYRPRAPFVAYSYAEPDPDKAVPAMVDRARRAIEESGAPIFEVKIGVHPVELEIEMVEALHRALAGRARIAVDANMGLSFAAARKFAVATAPFLENLEEPVASLADMERLSGEYAIDVSTHCSDLEVILKYPGIGGIVPTLDACGGISAVRKLAEVCGAHGRRLWLRSHAESGIGWAAMVHLGISVPGLNRPGQSLIDSIEDDLILGDRWHVRSGGVVPPEKPGLGIEPDWDAIGRYHDAFLADGEIQAFTPSPDNFQ
ncbi:mandelate racemase/muconate lactonizing enzyme family protein [Sphingopyxis panaciterrae]